MSIMETILNEIHGVVKEINETEIDQAVTKLLTAKRIFVIGEGRSGLMAKAFAMRLMHLGAESYVIGETITPAIHKEDMLVAISGSGSTHHVVWTAQKAKEEGVVVQVISATKEGELAKFADSLIFVPAATKFRHKGEASSMQPLGSLFDQSAHIIFDALCMKYAIEKQVSQSESFKMHSNLES